MRREKRYGKCENEAATIYGISRDAKQSGHMTHCLATDQMVAL